MWENVDPRYLYCIFIVSNICRRIDQSPTPDLLRVWTYTIPSKKLYLNTAMFLPKLLAPFMFNYIDLNKNIYTITIYVYFMIWYQPKNYSSHIPKRKALSNERGSKDCSRKKGRLRQIIDQCIAFHIYKWVVESYIWLLHYTKGLKKNW